MKKAPFKDYIKESEPGKRDKCSIHKKTIYWNL